MSINDLLHLAIGRLGTGKMRTALTMLGIIIGVASVVALVSVGSGRHQGISNQLNALGTNLLTVSPAFPAARPRAAPLARPRPSPSTTPAPSPDCPASSTSPPS